MAKGLKVIYSTEGSDPGGGDQRWAVREQVRTEERKEGVPGMGTVMGKGPEARISRSI